MNENFSEVIEYLDGKFNRVDERFQKIDERFNRMFEVFATKGDIKELTNRIERLEGVCPWFNKCN